MAGWLHQENPDFWFTVAANILNVGTVITNDNIFKEKMIDGV